MITIRLKDLMLQRGIKPGAFQLLKIGIPETAAKSYLSGSAKSIKLDHLEKICLQFNCTPKELLSVEMDIKSPIPANHPLTDWVGYSLPSAIEMIRNMSPAQLEEAAKLLKEIKKNGV